MTEINEFVICMGCQNSFHMNDCEPFDRLGNEDGLGFVYCRQCIGKIKAEFSNCYYMNCNNKPKFFRKLDQNKRPICFFHYNKLSSLEKRHYFKFS